MRAWRLTPPPRWRPRAEKREMIEIYCQKGLTVEDATRLVDVFTRKPSYKKFFVDHMVVHELGAVVPGPDDNPIKNGL